VIINSVRFQRNVLPAERRFPENDIYKEVVMLQR